MPRFSGSLDHVSIRKVCDSLKVCFDAALIHPKDERTGKLSGGPSGEAVQTRGWAEARYLRPLFKHAFNGTCFHPDGSRKTFADVGSNIGLYSLYFARQCVVEHNPFAVQWRCAGRVVVCHCLLSVASPLGFRTTIPPLFTPLITSLVFEQAGLHSPRDRTDPS